MVALYSRDILAIVVWYANENSLMPLSTQENKKLTSNVRLVNRATMSTKTIKIKLEHNLINEVAIELHKF